MSDEESKKILNEIDELDSKDLENENENESKKSGVSILDIIIVILIIVLAIVILNIYFAIKKSSNNTSESVDNMDNIMHSFQEEYIEEDVNNSTEVDDSENYYNFDSNDSSSSMSIRKKYNQNIELKNVYNDKKNKSLVAELTNKNNDVLMYVEIYIAYYDEKNRIIDMDMEELETVSANSDFYITFEDKSEYSSKYEIFALCSGYKDSKNIKDEIEYSFNKEDMKLEVHNNSKENIDNIQFAVKFYDDNNNLVFTNYIEDENFVSSSSEEYEVEYEKPFDDDDIEYSKVDIELISAYSNSN